MEAALPRRALNLLFLPTFLMLTGATYKVELLGNATMQSPHPVKSGTELDLAPGETVLEATVGPRSAAILAADLPVSIGGQTFVISKDVPLPEALISGRGARALGPTSFEYCALPPLPALCVIDSDGDGAADKAILTAGHGADMPPVMIPRTALKVRSDLPLPGESSVRIVYAGPRTASMRPTFQLLITENGQKLSFFNNGVSLKRDTLPTSVTMMGARFLVTSYEAGTRHVMLKILSDVPAAPYDLTVTRTTTFVPIFR